MRAGVLSYEGHILELHRLADDKAFMAVSVSKRRSRSEEFVATHGVSVRILVSACKFLWRPVSWVLVARGCGAHLYGWFH